MTAGFGGGDVGIYVRHLPTGREVAIRADEVFPTASMVKVPLLVTLYDRAEQGAIKLDSAFVFQDTMRYADYDLSGKLRQGQTLTPRELAFLMIGLSDNTASLWLQRLVGTGSQVNRWLEAHGFQHTRVNSRTPGREAARTEHGWGQTTPREIAELMVRIREGRAVSPQASEQMYRTLTNNAWEDVGASVIPPTVQVASKYGAVDRFRGEVLLVNAPRGDYVLAVLAKNLQDQSWKPDNAAWTLTRNISRTVYQHFNGR
jgi:beta-lactamase class A